jgi:hypothetical protein
MTGAVVSARATDSPYTIGLSIKNGYIVNSTIDAGAGAVYPCWSDNGGIAPSEANTVISGTYITSTGAGIVCAGFDMQVIVEDSTLVGAPHGPTTAYVPYIQNPAAIFQRNTVIISKMGIRPGSTFQVASLLQGMRYSHTNTFKTDLVDPGAVFWVSYNATPVVNDYYLPTGRIVPYGGGTFVGGYYNQ